MSEEKRPAVARLPLEDYEYGEDGVCYTTFRQRVKHMVGLDYADTPGHMYVRHGVVYWRAWRNHYSCAGIDRDFEELVSAGLAEYAEYMTDWKPARTYRLTKAGLEWLGKELNLVIRMND